MALRGTAVLRVFLRRDLLPKPVPKCSALKTLRQLDEEKQLKYPLQWNAINQNARDGPIGNTEQLPFRIDRSFRENIPVYTKLSHSGPRTDTVLKNVNGNIDALVSELEFIISTQAGKQCSISRHEGSLRVRGNYLSLVKQWVRLLGY
eukprot:Rmarinus@m.9487